LNGNQFCSGRAAAFVDKILKGTKLSDITRA
jgi:hypothetical protein